MKKNVFTLMLLLPATSQAVEVSTPTEFNAAITKGGDVVLRGDLTLTSDQAPIFTDAKILTIDGQRHTIDGGENRNQYIRFMPGSEVDEIKDITFQNVVNQVIPNGEDGTKLDPDDNQGGVISNYGHIKSINANFYNNQAFNGGAINNGGYIESINGEFKGNKALGGGESAGAAIYNNGWGSKAVIDNITGLFEDNLAGLHAAIWNGNGTINNISATFKNNHRSSIGSNAGVTNISNSTFYKNTSEGIEGVGQAGSGIIYYGSANINVKDSIFEENYALWKGAAIAGTGGSGNLTISGSKFINNSAGEEGGTIYTNSIGKVDISDSVFTGNRGNWGGGAIYNGKATYTITGSTFDNNRTGWYGGIYNGGTMDIANSAITNNFANGGGAGIGNSGVLKITDTEIANNKIEYWEDIASGGGIQSSKGSLSVTGGSIHDNSASSKGGAVYISGGEATLTSVDIKGNKSGKGGAVHSLVDLTMAADGKDMLIAGNNADTNQTGVFMETEDTTLSLSTANNGKVLFDDIVDGNTYNLNISGDESGRVEFRNNLNNVNTLTMAEGGTLYMAKDQKLNVKNLTGQNGSLWLDAETDFDNNTLKNGVLEVAEDVSGNTNVIVNFLNTAEAANSEEVLSPFVMAANDDKTTDASFKVKRVVSSPYMWETRYNVKGDEEGSVWYLGIQKKDEPVNPKPDDPTDPIPEPSNPVYAPEIAAYAGVQRAAVEQNRNISESVARGISPEKSVSCYEESCGIAEAVVRKKAWIDVVHENSESTAPIDMDAKIQGVTAGLDVYADDEHRAGLFGSYRNGKYDLSGKGDYFSNIGSDIKSDSYLGGLYYQYKHNNWKMLGTLFAGKQDLDISTDDKVVSTSADAMQYGASTELSKKFAIAQYLNLEPSLGLRYTMTDIDSLSDKVGKRADFDVLHFAEVELGARLEYLLCREGCTNRLYAKPSVIQTFVKGGKTQITGLQNEVKSMQSQTLGRLEVGGEFGLSSSLFGYAAAGYTFGEDYNAYDVNLGLNYAF